VNQSEAARIVAVICTSYPQQASKLDREAKLGMASTFALMLDDIPYDRANAALRVLIQTRTWMPSVADIRSTVAELERGPVRAGGDAWGSVIAAIRAQGAYRTPGTDFVFHDPLVARCVEALGWQNLCSSEMAASDRKQFVDLYDRLADQRRRQTVAPSLQSAPEVDVVQIAAVGDLVKQIAGRS